MKKAIVRKSTTDSKCYVCQSYDIDASKCRTLGKTVKSSNVCDLWEYRPAAAPQGSDRLGAAVPLVPGADECVKCIKRERAGICSLVQRYVEEDSFCGQFERR